MKSAFVVFLRITTTSSLLHRVIRAKWIFERNQYMCTPCIHIFKYCMLKKRFSWSDSCTIDVSTCTSGNHLFYGLVLTSPYKRWIPHRWWKMPSHLTENACHLIILYSYLLFLRSEPNKLRTSYFIEVSFYLLEFSPAPFK